MMLTEQVVKRFVGGHAEINRSRQPYKSKIEDIYLEGKGSGKTLVIVTQSGVLSAPKGFRPKLPTRRLVVETLRATPLYDGRVLLEDIGLDLKLTLYPKGWRDTTVRPAPPVKVTRPRIRP